MFAYIEHEVFRYYLHNGNPIYCHSLTDRNSYRLILGNLVSNHLCSITELTEALGEGRKNIERYAKTFHEKGASHFFLRKETRGQCYKLTENLCTEIQPSLDEDIKVETRIEETDMKLHEEAVVIDKYSAFIFSICVICVLKCLSTSQASPVPCKTDNTPAE
jgi:hypothetical protein